MINAAWPCDESVASLPLAAAPEGFGAELVGDLRSLDSDMAKSVVASHGE